MTKVRGMIFLLDCTQGPRSLNRSRLHLISYSFKLISYGKNKHSGQIGACAGVSIFRRPCGNFPAKQKKILLSRKINRRKLKRKRKQEWREANLETFRRQSLFKYEHPIELSIALSKILYVSKTT